MLSRRVPIWPDQKKQGMNSYKWRGLQSTKSPTQLLSWWLWLQNVFTYFITGSKWNADLYQNDSIKCSFLYRCHTDNDSPIQFHASGVPRHIIRLSDGPSEWNHVKHSIQFLPHAKILTKNSDGQKHYLDKGVKHIHEHEWHFRKLAALTARWPICFSKL